MSRTLLHSRCQPETAHALDETRSEDHLNLRALPARTVQEKQATWCGRIRLDEILACHDRSAPFLAPITASAVRFHANCRDVLHHSPPACFRYPSRQQTEAFAKTATLEHIQRYRSGNISRSCMNGQEILVEASLQAEDWTNRTPAPMFRAQDEQEREDGDRDRCRDCFGSAGLRDHCRGRRRPSWSSSTRSSLRASP